MRNKILCFVLTLCMLLPLCGCGANLDEKVVGTWDCYYTSDYSSGLVSDGDKKFGTLKIYKGGTGAYTSYKNGSEINHCTIEWKNVDGILNVTYLWSSDMVNGYEYDDESDTLHSVDDSAIFIRTQ